MKTNLVYINPEGSLLTKALEDSIKYQRNKLSENERRLRERTNDILANYKEIRGGVQFISRAIARQLARHELFLEDTNQTDQWNQYLEDQILGPDKGKNVARFS